MTCMHQGPPPKEWNCSLERDHDGPHVARTAFGRFTWPNDARAASPPDDLDELDRLHAAATAGEWKDHGDESVRWDDPMACGYDSREHHRGPPYYCTGPRCETMERAEADASAIVALHNAWPEVSAQLRAAEAVLRVIVACDDAINRGDEPPLSRAEVAAAARAALGEP